MEKPGNRDSIDWPPSALSLSVSFDQGGDQNEVVVLSICAPAPCRRCVAGFSGRVHFCCGPRCRHDSPGHAQAPNLGTAASFAVLAGSTVTNTGPSVINGNVGVSPGSAVVGFPPGILVPPGTIHAADAVAGQAQVDLTTAYNVLAGRPSTANLTGQDLGGLVLTPGVYTFNNPRN